MSKRTTFTSITPLPSTIARETAIRFLQDHIGMIDLNPLVIDRHRIEPPDYAGSDERECAWYSITDRIEYLPGAGDWAAGSTSYATAFHDMPWGLQTHSYAAMGLEIRGKWSVGGSLPGEPHEPQELGLGAPETGLYLREDVDYTCNVLMAGFVKKTMKKAHTTLVETLKERAEAMQQQQPNGSSANVNGGRRTSPERGIVSRPTISRPPLSQHPVGSSASGRSWQQQNGGSYMSSTSGPPPSEKQSMQRPHLPQQPMNSSSSGRSLQQQYPQQHQQQQHQQQPPPYQDSRQPPHDPRYPNQQQGPVSQSPLPPLRQFTPLPQFSDPDQRKPSYQQTAHERLLFQQQPDRYQGYKAPPPEIHEAP